MRRSSPPLLRALLLALPLVLTAAATPVPARACGNEGEPALGPAPEDGHGSRGAIPASLLLASQGRAAGWGVPQLVGGAVNTPGVDCAPAITLQGDRLYFERPAGPFGHNDIFVSYLSDSGWTDPQNLGPPVNTDNYGEGKPAVSASGDSLFFSHRGDIYMATWNGSSWNDPVPFSDVINDPGSGESSPYLSADGQEFYFTAQRSDGYGWSDIYVSTWNGTDWDPPQNLGPNVNTSDNEWYCCLSPDGNTLYFVTSRPGGYGNIDHWSSQREPGGWSLPTNLGDLANSTGPSCKLSISGDGQTIYFGGSRPGEGAGGLDIWFMTRTAGE